MKSFIGYFGACTWFLPIIANVTYLPLMGNTPAKAAFLLLSMGMLAITIKCLKN